MTIRMNNLEQLTLDEMEEFVTSHRHLNWSATGQKSVYGLIEGVLKAQRYGHLNKGQKGVIKGFLAKVTALSRAQITRLIQRWIQTKRIERQPGRQPTFPRRYTAADVAVLAEVDAAHEDLSGPAVRYLCQRGWGVYEDKRSEEHTSELQSL